MCIMTAKNNILWWFNLKTWLFLIFSQSFWAGPAIAQPPVAFKNYSVIHGLSHNVVRGVIQDAEGFIWVATQDGLCRFNGYTFKVYKVISGDSTSLSSNKIITLEEDKNHNIWVATWGGGLCVYNRKLDRFKRIMRATGNDSTGPSSNYIYDLYQDAKGRMWIGTAGRGLDVADVESHTFRHYRHAVDNPNSLSHNRVISITEDGNGKLWIGTSGGGLNHFDPDTGIFERYLHQEDDAQSLSDNDVYSVFYDSKQRLWVGTRNDGLNLMENGKFIRFQHNRKNPHSVSNNQIWAIGETGDGIWVGTDNGLLLFNETERNFYVYKNNSFAPKSLAANSVKALYTDPQGRLWVGTYNGGVSIFDKSLVQMRHYFSLPNENSLSYNNISACLQAEDGKVLIGADGGGLNIFDTVNEQFVHYKHDPENPKSIGSNKPLTMLQDSRHRVWIGFWDGGLDYLDRDRQTFIHYNQNMGYPNGPSNNNITCLAEDQEGFIWMGTFGGGVNKFDPENGTFQYFFQDIDNPQSLSDRDVWSLLADSQNNIWVGTSNGILHLLDRENGSFIRINVQEPGESNHSILALFEDDKGSIWLGLEGGSLKQMDRENRTFQTFTTDDGLPSNSVNAIEEDRNGNLWLGTNNGISRFDPEEHTFTNYHNSDGLQGLYFNRQASELLASGELLFGGQNGFNLFHPDSLADHTLSAPMVFTDFQIFNKAVPIGGKGSPLSAHINATEAITLSYKQSVFSIEYASLNYTDPENIRYKYRLKGFVDESWQEAGKERKVTYTNLQPSEYLFEVTTANHDNDNVETPYHALSITVTPPWWQTWWARLLAGMFLGVLLLTIYQLRLRSIKAHNKRLEKEVTARTVGLQQANNVLREMNKLIQEQKEEIQAQTEELSASNEEIRSINQKLEEMVEMRTADLRKSNEELDNFVYRVSHDIRAPLSSVLGLVELMEIEKDSPQLSEYLKMATQSINKLDGFVKDILDYSRNSRMEVEREEINFSQLLDNILEELQYMKKAGRLKIIRDFQLSRPYYNDPRRLYIIFRNLFSNAIKYQNPYIPNPFVRVKIKSKEEGVVIIVEDNGIGIAAKESARVFDMFYRGSDLSTGSGIGLYIVKETVEKLGGHVSLRTQLGHGTILTIELPEIRSKSENTFVKQDLKK